MRCPKCNHFMHRTGQYFHKKEMYYTCRKCSHQHIESMFEPYNKNAPLKKFDNGIMQWYERTNKK